MRSFTSGIGVLCLLLLLGCQPTAPEELEFFEVQIEDPILLELGRVELRARLSGLSGSSVEEAGFLVSEDANEVITPSAALVPLEASPPSGNGNFSVELNLQQGQTIYFRAFARLDERLVYSQEIRVYGLDQVVRLVGQEAQVLNNQMSIQGQLLGLEALGLRVAEHGHIYAPLGQELLIDAPNTMRSRLGAANDDYVFVSQLEGLVFNTLYAVRAYALTESGSVFYSDTRVDTIKGGWAQIADFPTLYHKGTASATADASSAIAGFGLDMESASAEADHPRECWRFNADSEDWSPIVNYSLGSAHINASSFSLGDTVYFVYGEYTFENDKYYTREVHKYAVQSGTWSRSQTPQAMRRLSGTVSFVLNGKAYLGTGEYFNSQISEKEYTGDFWEYTPEQGSWRQVASLPSKRPDSPTVVYAGRFEAAAFTAAGHAYVVGGNNASVYFSDCWKFTPPLSPQDSGAWSFVNYFEGGPRVEAVAFSIDDKGYVGLGTNVDRNFDDMWEFLPTTNQWIRKNDFPGGRRREALAFTLDGRGYVGTGFGRVVQANEISGEELFNDGWRFIPDQF